jgi:galacturan 1,4-alpha-galacturonidase
VVIDGVLQPGGNHLSGDAWITFSGVNNLLVTGAGTLDAQGDQSGKEWESKPTTLLLERTTNSTVRGLSFMNSRGFHLNFRHSSRVVAEGLHIKAPADSSNTDGIHVARSNHVRILHSVIGTGDDCVSVGPGSTDVVVHGVVCGPGHGISVGSLGKDEGEEDVRGLVVRNCTVRGTTNGVRIKTWPGSPPSRASNITFEDIAMADVSNPVVIDQRYCPHDHCNSHRPSLVQISDVTFRQITGTSKTKVAVQLLCSSKRPCSREIVNMQGIPPTPAARGRSRRSTRTGTEQLVQ